MIFRPLNVDLIVLNDVRLFVKRRLFLGNVFDKWCFDHWCSSFSLKSFFLFSSRWFIEKIWSIVAIVFFVRFNSISRRTSKNSIWRAMKTFKCKERTKKRKGENEWNQVLVKYNVRFIDFSFDILDERVQFAFFFPFTSWSHLIIEHVQMMKVPIRVSRTGRNHRSTRFGFSIFFCH